MFLQTLRKELKEKLQKTGDPNFSKTVDVLLSQTLFIDRNSVLFADIFISDLMVKKIRELAARIEKGEPAAHVLGTVPFFGCKIHVTKDVLIPRPETERLTDLVSHDIIKKNYRDRTLWDLCTGSGCIGISLKKKFPELRVVLSDISEKALEVAKENAKQNKVEVEFRLGDLFAPFQGEKADIIVSNPPYVSLAEYETLDPSVKEYEPKVALVAEDDGLYFYKQIAAQAPQFLKPYGLLWLEIGYNQADKVKEIFHKPKILQDYSGHDRFLRAEMS